MKFLTHLLAVLLATSVLGETPALQVRMSSISVTQCRRAESAYEIDIEGAFELENTSKSTLLVSKKVDGVSNIEAASSQEELKRKKYSLAMDQQLGGVPTNPAPQLKDFIALRPGQKGLIQIGAVVPASTDPTYSGSEYLRPGKSWVQFQFSTLPLSLKGSRALNSLRRKWRSSGLLLDEDLQTEAFPVDWAPDPKAPKCD